MKYSEVAADIAAAVDAVPRYQNYDTSQGLVSHFIALEKGLYPGVSVEVDEPLGWQQAPDGTLKPHIKSAVDVGDGRTVYLKGGVHGNELAYRRTQQYISELACHNPEFFRRLEVGRLVFMDADPVTTELNEWHFKPLSLYNYLVGARRSAEQADWDYPIEHGGYVHKSHVSGCIASQEIINTEQPDLLFPLHNGTAGSYFCYLVNEPPGLAEVLSKFLKGLYGRVPPSGPDMPTAPKLADGVFQPIPWEELFDGDIKFGDSSLGYASRQAQQEDRMLPLGCVVDSTYFCVEAYANQQPSGLTRRQAHRRTITRALENIAFADKFAETLNIEQGERGWELHRDIKLYTGYWTQDLEADLQRDLEEPDAELVVSEVAQMVTMNNFYPALPLGMLANLAETIGSADAPQITARLGQEADFLTNVLAPKLEPPRRLVQTQLGAILLSCASLCGGASNRDSV